MLISVAVNAKIHAIVHVYSHDSIGRMHLCMTKRNEYLGG